MPRVVPADEQQTIAGRITRSLRNRVISADSDTSRSSTPVNELSPILEKGKQKTSALATPKARSTRKGSQSETTTPAKSRSRRGSLSEIDARSVSSPSSIVSEEDASSTSSRTRLRKSPLVINTPIKEENEDVKVESSARKRGRPRRIDKDKENKEAEKSNMNLKSKKTSPAVVESDVIINLDDDDDEEEERVEENTSNESKKSPSSDEKNGSKRMRIKLKKINFKDGIEEHDGDTADIESNKRKEDDVNKKTTKGPSKNKKEDVKDKGSDDKEITEDKTSDENEKEENNPKEDNIEKPILRDKGKKEDDSKSTNESLDPAVPEDKNIITIEKESFNESEKGDDGEILSEQDSLSYTIENKNKDNVTQNKENENILISQKENEKQQDKEHEDVEKLESIQEESIINKDDITNTNFNSNNTQDLNLEKSNVVEDIVATNDIIMDETVKDDVNMDSNVTEDQDFESNAVESESKDLQKDKEQIINSSEVPQNKILQEISDSSLTEQSEEKNTTKDHEEKDKSKKQKSVTFGTNKTDKISTNYPKTPLMMKSKSYSDSRSISVRCLDTSHDTDTSADISGLSKESNEKSQENSNSEKIDDFHDSETPYKGLRGKTSLSSSTPIATCRNQIKDDNENSEILKQDKIDLPNPIVEDSHQVNETEEPTTMLKEDVKKTSKSSLKTTAPSSTFQNENENKSTEYEFSKTWSQSVTVNVTDDAKKGKYIDSYGIQSEAKKVIKATKLIAKKHIPERPSHSDSESYEESDIDEDNETRNEFIDDEAEEAEEENSLCSEERAYLEENEVPVDGISIGSADTDADSGEEEDECDSFIVSDREDDDELLSYDTEEIFSNSDDNSVKQRKQKRRAILLVQSSDEESVAVTSKPDIPDRVLQKTTKKRARILISSDEEENDSVILSTAASERSDRKNLTLKDEINVLEAIPEDRETSQNSDINNDTQNVDECNLGELVADGNTSKDLDSTKVSEYKDESTQVDIDLPVIQKKSSTTQTSPDSEQERNDIQLLEASAQKDENDRARNSEVLNQASLSIQGGKSLDINAQKKESISEEDSTKKEATRKLSFSSEQQRKSISSNKSANLSAPTAGQNTNISILNVNEKSLTIQQNITETSMRNSKESVLLARVDFEEKDSSVTTSEKGEQTESASSKKLSKDIQTDCTSDVSIPNKKDGLTPTGNKETEATNAGEGLEQNKSLELTAKKKKISSNNEEIDEREQASTRPLNNEEETTPVLSSEVNEVNVKFSAFKNNSLDLLRKRKLAATQKVLSSSFSGFISNKYRTSQESTDSEEDIATRPVQKKLRKSSLSHSLNQSLYPENNEQPDSSESSTDEQNEIDNNNKETNINESTFSFADNESDFASSSKTTFRTEFDKKRKGDINKKYNLAGEDNQLADHATTPKNISDDLKNAGTPFEKYSPNMDSIPSEVNTTTTTGDEAEMESWQQVDDSTSNLSSLDEEETRLIQHIEEIKKKRTKKQIQELSIKNLQLPEDKEKRKAIAKALEFGMLLLKRQVVDITTARVAKYGNATPSELALINSRAMKVKKLKKAKGLANDECFLQQESGYSVYSDEHSQLVPDSLIEALDREHRKATRGAVESKDSSSSSSISKKKRKRKVIAKTPKDSSPENISRVIKTASGMFCEEPIKQKRKSDNTSKNYKKTKLLSTIELATGLVYERPLTPIHRKIVNGFQETVATPRNIGFKVSHNLSAGQMKETPEYNRKDFRGKRKLQLSGPSMASSKPKWTNSGEFTVTKYPKLKP